MALSFCIAGRHIEVVGDGMAPGTSAGAWARDSRESRCFGGFGHLTLEGDALTAAELTVVVAVLEGNYLAGVGYDSDEVAQ